MKKQSEFNQHYHKTWLGTILKYIDLEDEIVKEIDVNEIKSIKIAQGDNDFIICLKNDTKIYCKKYKRYSPLRFVLAKCKKCIFIEYTFMFKSYPEYIRLVYI